MVIIIIVIVIILILIIITIIIIIMIIIIMIIILSFSVFTGSYNAVKITFVLNDNSTSRSLPVCCNKRLKMAREGSLNDALRMFVGLSIIDRCL